LLLTTGEG